MIRMMRNRTRISLTAATLLTLLAIAAVAGPPLICWPFDIGDAKSLPFGGGNWNAPDPSYNIQNLADDTLALLQPTTPVIVRMETIRRATVYTMKDRDAAVQLLERLEARSNESAKSSKTDSLALFDLGYMIETYKQAHWRDALTEIAAGRDGYAMITRAIQLRGHDAEMEFAAALIKTDFADSASIRTAHLRLAVAGARDGSLLAKNILSHSALLQVKSDSLAELRTQLQSK
jgi:hypothetical protein